jgi:hypothetical protein
MRPKPPMQVPGRFDIETGQVVVDKPELQKKSEHFIDIDGDGTISKMEFARWFWHKKGRYDIILLLSMRY